MTGGDAFVFTDLPKGASDPKWSPDAKSIVFTQQLESGRPRETGAEEKERRGRSEARGNGGELTGSFA
jgi:dipeptidyl aminopeptidase/acylaminoacyl peptidase